MKKSGQRMKLSAISNQFSAIWRMSVGELGGLKPFAS
jgi:hypothetical protein